MDLVDPAKIEDWNFEVYDTEEVDPNES
jgi:hypothetical protein